MKSAIKIGRDQSNDIIINEPRVSRNHAIITLLPDGRYELKDLGSTNGSYVNGQRIHSSYLSPDDRIQVASSLLNWETILAAFQPKTSEDHLIAEEPHQKIRKSITLGKDIGNDIVFDSQFVSGKHAQISVLKDGSYFIEDLGSSNGTYVNGVRVTGRNFLRTDRIKLADEELPANWFSAPGLQRNFIREHRTWIMVSSIAIVLIGGSLLAYVNRCQWFGIGCNLTAGAMVEKYSNTQLHISHSYYYTVALDGKTYYVGKNASFPLQTEGNPDKNNIRFYNSISGNGVFISNDGTIITTPGIANPWLDETEKRQMIEELIASKTVPGLNKNSQVIICGETAELKFLVPGSINNEKNCIAARGFPDCEKTDSTRMMIQSVKENIPEGGTNVKIGWKDKTEKLLRTTENQFIGYSQLPAENQMIRDTFYSITDTIDINRIKERSLPDSIPVPNNGCGVFNQRGQLIGIIESGRIKYLSQYTKQINNR
jgi:pSer/pThr/pTyr-binding forkhead associated (FHA) protein